jgi:hypothetical protein
MEELNLHKKELKYCSDFYTKTIRHLLDCKSDRPILLDPKLFKDFLVNVFGIREHENLYKYMTLKHEVVIKRIDDYLLGLG